MKHQIEVDTAGRSADDPLIPRKVRRSYRPWCRTCGWESDKTYVSMTGSAVAAVAHQQEAS